MARMLAADKGINLASVSRRGSGFEGSITAKDIEQLGASAPAQTSSVAASAPAQPAPGQKFVDVPVTNIRGVIAKRLVQSKQNIPHYYLSASFHLFHALFILFSLIFNLFHTGRCYNGRYSAATHRV